MPMNEVAPLQSAAGGVGLLFTQWAKALGVRVLGTVSSEAKAAAARRAGCVQVLGPVVIELDDLLEQYGMRSLRTAICQMLEFHLTARSARAPGGVDDGAKLVIVP